jgi:hypothetical protein
MRTSLQYLRSGGGTRCAICDGKFGLIRYYCCKAALCSKKCTDRLKARQECDREWLGRFNAA